MSVEQNKAAVLRTFAEGFNRGDLAVIDELVLPVLDHQHPDEPSFREHLKDVIRAMRTAFPDLHFEINQVIGEGDWVALHSSMTGTHQGDLGPPLLPPSGRPVVPATGRPINVAHMHLIRFVDGKATELWHVMDTMGLVGQLGLMTGGGRPGAETRGT